MREMRNEEGCRQSTMEEVKDKVQSTIDVLSLFQKVFVRLLAESASQDSLESQPSRNGSGHDATGRHSSNI